MRMTTLSNSLEKLMLDEDLGLDFAGLGPNDIQQSSSRIEEREVSIDDVKNRLEESESYPVYQVLSTEEIAESVQAGEQPGESSSID